MKKILVISIAFISFLTLISCGNKTQSENTNTADSANVQSANDTLPSANIQHRIIPIAFNFNNICNMSGINIKYQQGEECQIELEGDSALLNHVLVDIESGLLTLGLQTDSHKDINVYESNYNITAHITTPTLQYVSLCESGNFYCQSWQGTNIHIGCLSRGSFYCDNITCDTFKFEGNDYDRSDFKNIKAQSASVICLRHAQPTFYFDVTNLLVIAEGESNPTISGKALNLQRNIRGKAKLVDNLD